MKAFFACLCLAFCVSTVAADRGPVDFYDCSGKRDGNYVHPFDCTKFMTCIAGLYAYERDCAAGLNYHRPTDRCDYPEIAGCVTDPGTTTTVSTTPTTTVSTTPPTTTTITSTSTITTTLPPPTSSVPPPLVDFYNCSGKPDGNYVHPFDCTKFISCVAETYAYEMDCPAGLHYYYPTDKCEYPEIAGCITDPPETSTTTMSTTNTPITSSEPTTFPPTATTTNTPITSTNATTTVEPSTTFSTNATTTVEPSTTFSTNATTPPIEISTPFPTNATTTDEPSSPELTTWGPSETTPFPPENGTSTQSPPENSTTLNPDACDHDCEYVGIDCHNYYTCVNFERKVYLECPEKDGLAFNPTLKVCDRIENVKGCQPPTSEPPSTTEPSCGCEYKPHETDCRNYYFCSESCRKASCELRTCPGDLLWSVDFHMDGTQIQQCALPGNASCASLGSGSARLEFSCLKKSDGLYSNEMNCHSYWKCNDGIALLFDCPKDFIYNSDLKICDFPARALKYCTHDE